MVSSEYLNDLQIDFRQRSSFHIDIRKNAMYSLSHDDILLLKPYYQLIKTNIEKATNESKDIITYNYATPKQVIYTNKGDAVFLDKDDAHMCGLPNLKESLIKKMIIKVPVGMINY